MSIGRTELHRVIQVAFGRSDCHLHGFRIGKEGERFEYIYDIGRGEAV